MKLNQQIKLLTQKTQLQQQEDSIKMDSKAQQEVMEDLQYKIKKYQTLYDNAKGQN